MNELTPQEGFKQLFSEIDVEFEDVVPFLQMNHELSEAVHYWIGEKNEGWTILRNCSEIIPSLREGHEVDISSLAVLTGVSRHTVRRFQEKVRDRSAKGSTFTKVG